MVLTSSCVNDIIRLYPSIIIYINSQAASLGKMCTYSKNVSSAINFPLADLDHRMTFFYKKIPDKIPSGMHKWRLSNSLSGSHYTDLRVPFFLPNS